jgi:hypothetical protein
VTVTLVLDVVLVQRLAICCFGVALLSSLAVFAGEWRDRVRS